MTNGKGSTRRPGRPGAYERGYDAIRWESKQKPAEPDYNNVRKRDGTWLVKDGKIVRLPVKGQVGP